MKVKMSKDYLRELVAEARRNETVGWLLLVAGLLLLLGTLYFQRLTPNQSSYESNLGALFTLVLISIGVVLAGYYGARKKRYMEKFRES